MELLEYIVLEPFFRKDYLTSLRINGHGVITNNRSDFNYQDKFSFVNVGIFQIADNKFSVGYDFSGGWFGCSSPATLQYSVYPTFKGAMLSALEHALKDFRREEKGKYSKVVEVLNNQINKIKNG